MKGQNGVEAQKPGRSKFSIRWEQQWTQYISIDKAVSLALLAPLGPLASPGPSRINLLGRTDTKKKRRVVRDFISIVPIRISAVQAARGVSEPGEVENYLHISYR